MQLCASGICTSKGIFASVNKTLAAHLALLIAMLIYAASFTIAKEVTPKYIDPFGFVLLRVIGAGALLWLTDLLFIREKVERKDLLKLLPLAIFGVALNQMLFIKGLSLTSPISAAIMMITSPILVLIIGSFVLKERITWLRGGGILLGFAGAVMLILGGSAAASSGDDPLGDLYIFINALSWGTYLVLVKPLMKKYHTVTILRWVFTFGFFMVLPFGAKSALAVQWETFTPWIWFSALFVIVATTYVAYLLNTYALQALSPAVVSAYIYLQPVLAAAIALALGKDELSWTKVFSALVIFTGVYLASLPVKKGS